MANPAGLSSGSNLKSALAKVAALAALVLILGALTACNSSKPSDSPSPKITSTSAGGTVVTTTQRPAATAGPSQTSGSVADEPVAFQTDDGATIKGHLYTTPGPKQRAVIFAHMYPNDQRAWTAFAKELAGGGIATLTFDFRGYGESGGSKDISKIDHDLRYALLFLQSRDYPLIYLVGASMGGTAVLKVAASQEVAGIVTISAPVSFMGLDAGTDIPKVSVKKLILASKNESEGGGQAAQQIYQAAQEPKTLFLFDGSAHGTEILSGPNAGDLKSRITSFVSQP
jgi:pimeloyl-ACP methyl ester carboxylesterase